MSLYEKCPVCTNIVEELEKMKNLYSYSTNNQFYNSVIDMCISKVIEIRTGNLNSNQKITNEES